MARGFRESRRRDRTRRQLAIFKWLFLIFGLLALGWIAYAAGTELARGEVRTLKEQVRSLESDLSSITSRAESLQVERDEALAKQNELQERVPTGEAREIFALLGEQLKLGVKKDRLMFLVRSAGNPVRCRNAPEQKRFIVQTGFTRGKNDWVAFARSAIVVRATGEPSRDSSGNAQAWFDEEQPVKVSFSKINGATTEVSGVLPLQHAVELGGDEYRFVITPASARGFLQVTGDKCQLPTGG